MIELSAGIKKPSFLTTASVFIGRSLLHSLRNVEALLMAILLPIMLMLLFTYVFGGAIDSSGNYVNYVVPGIILLCAGFGSSSTAVDVTTDMSNGIIDRFRMMPIFSMNVITGHVVASVARNIVATGIVFILALFLGFQPDATLVDWLVAIGIITLFILTITWLYAAIGLVTSTPATASGFGFVILFVPYLSSAFVPIETMPNWLRGIAENQPITPIIETIRSLLTGGSVGSNIWLAIGWCMFILVGSIVWSTWAFNRRSGRR